MKGEEKKNLAYTRRGGGKKKDVFLAKGGRLLLFNLDKKEKEASVYRPLGELDLARL